MHLPVSVSQIFTCVSYEAVAKLLPSDRNVAWRTPAVWPLYTRWHLRVPDVCQMRTVLSSDAVSRRWPVSGKKATSCTPLECPM